MFTRRRVTSANHLLLPILVLCGLIASCAPTSVPKPLVAKPVAGPSVKAQKPEWEVGYRWEYAWKRPERSGTTTEEVIRESTFEGVPCYVIKRGRREYFYTKADLGYIASMSSGRLRRKLTPPRQRLLWPLEVGKEWRNTYIQEKPLKKTSRRIDRRLVVAKLEEVKVPAGTFKAFRIERYNYGTLIEEFWYSPKVKWIVKSRTYLRDGAREDVELIDYKITHSSVW